MRRVLLCCLVLAGCQAPYRLPEPDWVADESDVLTSQEESALIDMLFALNDETTVEVACVTVHGTGELPIGPFADDLLWRWEVGVNGVFNGVVIVIDTKARQVQLARGSGMRWTLTDSDQDAIVRTMTDELKEDRYYDGLRAGIEQIATRVAGVPWDVSHYSLSALPVADGEGTIVSFTGTVQSVRDDTVLVLSEDSILARVVLLPGTSPSVMENVWHIHGRLVQRDPLTILLLGLETDEYIEPLEP